ncbi:unnamed protein product [Orchesella dallaii]|uniref:C2H2-type domain-containing protein n=1 Tax=Orchesella dallaii TaxID=48710 RepID=A0ABP1RAN2_9HEXA
MSFSSDSTISGDEEAEEVWFECRICNVRVTPEEKDAHRLLHKKDLEKSKKKKEAKEAAKKRRSARLNDSMFSPIGSAVTMFDPVPQEGSNTREEEEEEPAATVAPPTKKRKRRSYKRYDTAVTKRINDGG